METAAQGWSRDVMLANVAAGYKNAKGKAITNFCGTLPPVDSDFARYAFKDPYTFGFLGTQELKNEHAIEDKLTEHVVEFLLEMGRGFAFVGRQYRLMVDGDECKMDLLMYHLKMHRYVVIELKAVEFIPEFVGKLNYYISAVDEYLKTPQDNPTIGLLLCPTKSNEKVQFSLRGFSQPMGVAEYEIKQLIEEVQSALPSIEEKA
jgi:predicted nuclease of restriction endonuclease-like (RecB) superfamily